MTDKPRNAFELYCKSQNPAYKPTDDGVSNRRDWSIWQAATLSATPQWLPIADGLPAPMVDVLCLAKQINTGEFEIKQSCVNPVGTGFYVEYDEVGNAPIEEVTHWQPLPLPPTATPQGGA